MGNKIRQVLHTYTNGANFWMITAFWLLIHGMIIRSYGPTSSWPSEMRPRLLGSAVKGLLMPTFFLGVAVVSLLKLQFANARARLLPSFAAAHLIVPGVVIAATIAGSTWAIVWAGHASGSAVAALVVVEMATAVCLAYLGPAGPFVLCLILFLITLCDGDRFAAALILEGNPVIIVSAMCVGLASLAAVGARLSMLREDMPDYSWRTPGSTRAAGRLSERQGGGRTMARWGLLRRLRDVEFRLVFRHLPARAPLRRLLLRQLNDGFDARLLAPLQFGVVLFFVANQPSVPPTIHGGFLAGLSVLAPSLIAILFATPTLGKTTLPRLYLARESLYPLSRLSLVGDLALSSACSTAILAAAHCAGILAAVAIFHAEGTLAAPVLPYLALTIAQYAVVYCAIVWLALFRSVWVQAMGWFATSILSSALVTMALSLDWHSSPSSVPMIVILAVAIVALPVRAALVRWCRVELG